MTTQTTQIPDIRTVVDELLPDAPTSGAATFTIPIVQMTPNLSQLISTLPLGLALHLALTGLTEDYLDAPSWRPILKTLVTNLNHGFSQLEVRFNPWQTPYIILETATNLGYVLPLDRDGTHVLYLDLVGHNAEPGIRRMNQAIYDDSSDLQLEQGRETPHA